MTQERAELQIEFEAWARPLGIENIPAAWLAWQEKGRRHEAALVAKAKEIERLQAIVARIPKDAFTVDGLPCFGDEVVYDTGGEPLVVDNFWGTPLAGNKGPTSEEDIVLRVDECFASVEAAKAAEVMDEHSC